MLKKIIKEKNRVLRKLKKFFVKAEIAKIKKAYLIKNRSFSKRIILFIFPEDIEGINGGILSLYAIQNEVKNLKNLHNCNVFSTFLPHIVNQGYRYSKFENDMIILNFVELARNYKDLIYLELQIPEVYVYLFTKENKDFAFFFNWIKNIKNIKINILNQNDEFMPDLLVLNNLREITSDITITCAHKRYATLEKRNFYGFPLHLLTPRTSNEYYQENYENKTNTIVISPDEIDQKLYKTKLKKADILSIITKQLPNYQTIVINDFKYNDYKKLISKSKFAITFGEGLDAYFSEPIFSGSVSFACYNDTFFPENFKSLETVYDNFDKMLENIILDIKKYDEKDKYTQYNKSQRSLLDKLYSLEIFKSNLKQYYLGNLDFK